MGQLAPLHRGDVLGPGHEAVQGRQGGGYAAVVEIRA